MPRPPLLARAGSRIADVCERWFPDAFVFALAAIVLVFFAGLGWGVKPVTLAKEFGNGFWSLVNFTMQMAIVIVGGFIVASSPPVAALTRRLASIPKTARGAVAFVAAFAMLSSLLSWGLSLVFTGLLVREITKRVDADYRAIGAAAYLGLGSVWALGLSSSAALLQATKSSIPASLLPITGVIPLTQTIFLWQSMVMAAALVVVSIAVAYFSAPSEAEARTARAMGIELAEDAIEVPRAATPAERLENSPILNILIAALMFWFLFTQFRDKGGLAALDLNNFNFAFLAAGLLLHWRPRSFLRAVTKSVPAFVSVTTRSTFPIVVAIYSAILGMFVPSGGGKWVVEAPYVMAAANAWHMHLGWTVQIYNAGEALPNLINPFWMLPLMGILGVRARDLAGYSMLQLLFHVPIVILLCWVFAQTL